MTASLLQLLKELTIFGLKLVLSCKFAIVFFALLVLSHVFTFGLTRYDFLFVAMLLTQAIFILAKIESWNELKVIICFHIVGLVLELFKTQPSIGAWSYPESAFFKLGTVPLYSGFMYSAVASFVIQSWRILHVELKNYPPVYLTLPLAVLIYVHFFLRHYGLDLRIVVTALVFVMYFRTQVLFTTTQRRQLPLALGFLLVGGCLWIAENISTLLGAWQYPHQTQGWTLVHDTKILAWFLLYVVSFIIVTQLMIFRKKRHAPMVK